MRHLQKLLALSVLFLPGCVVTRNQSGADKESIVKTPTYLAIDLSGGPNATSYPIEYFDEVPPGGWGDVYKHLKLVLRRIPKGTFTMGSPADELGRTSYEVQRQVTISHEFWIGVFEVTGLQWEQVMGRGICGGIEPKIELSYDMIRGASAGSHWPASSAVDPSSFMGKLRARTGLQFDLPTEAQWEYACRAGTTTALNSGKNLTSEESDSNMAEVGRYLYNMNDGKGVWYYSTTVGSYLPNNWRLYDMHGNAWEWCLDWWGEFDSAAVEDPVGASSGSFRVLRGGCYEFRASECRSASRGGLEPFVDFGACGFRLALSPVALRGTEGDPFVPCVERDGERKNE